MDQLLHNQVFSGGLLLVILGGLFYYLKALPGRLYLWFERFFVITVEIRDEDESYVWMRTWLAQKLDKVLSVAVVSQRKTPAGNEPFDPFDSCGGEGGRPDRPTVHLVPGIGTYLFKYEGRHVVVTRGRKEGGGGNNTQGTTQAKEIFNLRIFSRDRGLVKRLLEECRDTVIPDDGKLDVMTASHYSWVVSSRIMPRPLDSVILPGGQAEAVLADMNRFMDGKDWYERVGVPYRRGYLFHGKPGNGKTSFVKALAGAMKMNIYALSLGDSVVTDGQAQTLFRMVADRSILLLEDVDCLFRRREKANRRANLTFSGMLNIIDGVAASEGRILVMTTNHPGRLDPALIRPGRVDVHVHFDNATGEQAGRLFKTFFPGHEAAAASFAAQVEDHQYSMATVQNYLMAHRDDPGAAVAFVDSMAGLQKSAETEVKLAPAGEDVAAVGADVEAMLTKDDDQETDDPHEAD